MGSLRGAPHLTVWFLGIQPARCPYGGAVPTAASARDGWAARCSSFSLSQGDWVGAGSILTDRDESENRTNMA